MDCISATEKITIEEQTFQDNVLLEMIKEICSEPECLSSNVREKVNTIIADCDLAQYTGLHKLSTADETTSTLLGKFRNRGIVNLLIRKTVSWNS